MSGVTLLLLLLSVPHRANAYVDPGSGAMLWQIAAAAVIGTLFYLRRVTLWLRDRLRLRTPRAMGFLFATTYAVLVSPLVCAVFQSHPVPRFSDIFLIG